MPLPQLLLLRSVSIHISIRRQTPDTHNPGQKRKKKTKYKKNHGQKEADEDDNSELMCQVRVVPRMKQFIALTVFFFVFFWLMLLSLLWLALN